MMYHADCHDVLPTLPANSLQLVLEDMPYFKTNLDFDCTLSVGKNGKGKPIDYSTRAGRQAVEAYLEAHLQALLPACAPNAVLVFTSKQPFATILNYVFADYWVDEAVWVKSNHTNPFCLKRKIASKHEIISVFALGKKYTFNPQILPGKPYTGFESTTGKTVGKVNGSAKSVHYANEGTRYQSSLLDFAREYGLHPTQKPLGLFRALVRMFSNQDDTVFDGFAGSGTTAIACLHENRKYICCEKDSIYFEKAQERIQKLKL